MSQTLKTIDDYKSTLDYINIASLKIFNTILPGQGYYRRYWIAILYTPIVVLLYIQFSLLAGEGQILSDNLFTAFMAVFSISFMLIAENVIGNNIRNTMKYIVEHFEIEEEELKEKYLSKIFTKWRIVFGLLTGIIFTTLAFFFVLNFPLGGHQSPLIKYSSLGIIFIMAYIFGEAGLGSLIIVYVQYRLMEDLSNRMEIMNQFHHDSLNKVGSWSLEIAVLLGVISSIGFIALVTNPHFFGGEIIFPFGLGKIGSQGITQIIFGIFGFVFVLVFIFFITPLYAIYSNIKEQKSKELELISNNYNRIHTGIIEALESGVPSSDLDADLNRLEALDLMAKKTKKVSPYPYDLKSLRRLLEATLIPAATFLLRNTDIPSLLGFT